MLQTLNTQVEAALQSGLNFKDRFRTNSRKRLLLVPADPDADEQHEQPLDDEGESASMCPATRRPGDMGMVLLTAGSVSVLQAGDCPLCLYAPYNCAPKRCLSVLCFCIADQRSSDAAEQDSEQQHPQQQPDRQQQQQQQQARQQQQQPGGKPGKPALGGGLKLTVGSNLETGEWKTGGVWLKKDKAEHEAVPSNLQIISADDLVKVGCSWGCVLQQMFKGKFA
jgi:hypothetical protein